MVLLGQYYIRIRITDDLCMVHCQTRWEFADLFRASPQNYAMNPQVSSRFQSFHDAFQVLDPPAKLLMLLLGRPDLGRQAQGFLVCADFNG